MLQDAIAQTNVDKIMLSSITEQSSFLYKTLVRRKKLTKDQFIEGKEYVTYPEFVKMSEH